MYHVYDLRALPVRTLATLAAGLPEGARVRRSKGQRVGTDTLLLAVIADRLGLLFWALAGGRGKKPSSLAAILTGKDGEPEDAASLTVEEFEAARDRILRGEKSSGKQ